MTAYVGEIRMFAGNFPPNGWMFCDGSPLPISENEVLFQLIGTTYGGDGETTFNLPDLRGRFPMHMGSNAFGTFTIGEAAGTESVTLTTQQIPIHTHPALAAGNTQQQPNSGNTATPGGAVWAAQSSTGVYANLNPANNMAPGAASPVGGSQPHENMPPFLAINFIIALFGIFPSP